MNAERVKLIKTTIIILLAAFFLMWLIKYFTTPKTVALPPPKVIVQKPKIAKITQYITQAGTLVAYNSVDLVARVEGYLRQIKFTDGTFVDKNQELFIIEPEPYLEKVKAAKALVAVQQAAYEYAKAEYERQKRMYKQNATSLNNVEKWSAKADESKAQIAKAVADATVAEINYSYTQVEAPFAGRIGRHLVDPGNLVGNGKATSLATIEQIDPIYVYFNLNELDLIKIRDAARAHSFNPTNISQIPVYVRMQNETKFSHEGKLNFVNTGLNASTGTLQFRALLPNPDYTLLPGLFVQVRIPISEAKPEPTIPDIAVQYDQVGAYVLTVDKNNIVVLKRVETGALEEGRRAILKGLDAGDSIIVSGLQNAIPGASVTPIQAEKKE